jgi:hypothetical protein
MAGELFRSQAVFTTDNAEAPANPASALDPPTSRPVSPCAPLDGSWRVDLMGGVPTDRDPAFFLLSSLSF